MDADADGSVQEQLAAVHAALQATKRQLKIERQRVKDQRKKDAKKWLLTGWLAHVVLITYMLVGQKVDPAVHFLAGIGRKRRWPHRK